MGIEELLLETATKRGEKRGEQRGEKKAQAKAHAEKLDMAREMKQDGISNERIAKFTKLPLEVVEKL